MSYWRKSYWRNSETPAEDVAIVRPCDMKAQQVRPSPAHDTELKRLDELDRKTQPESARCTF
jgi:hypothetical protein